MSRYSDELKEKMLNFNTEKKRRWAKERKPFSAFIELTPRCNMNCIHCYLQDYHKNDEMSYEEIADILDILSEKGILFITFSGGEIFAREDFVKIYLYAKKKGFLIELFSNGLNITNEILLTLEKYPPMLLEISLYGACEETYKKVTGISNAYDRVISNCKKLNEAGIRISLKTPVLKETHLEIDQMRKIAEEMNVPFCVTYEIDVTIDNDSKTKKHQLSVKDMLKYEFEDYEVYSEKLNSTNSDVDNIYTFDNDSIFICNVAQSSFIIDFEGRMCPCMKFRHRGIKLDKNNFDRIWKNFGEISKVKASKNYKCAKCKARYYCDICAAEREFIYGSLEAVNEADCRYAEARYAFYKEKWDIEKIMELVD